jgi:hypothetical protein
MFHIFDDKKFIIAEIRLTILCMHADDTSSLNTL